MIGATPVKPTISGCSTPRGHAGRDAPTPARWLETQDRDLDCIAWPGAVDDDWAGQWREIPSIQRFQIARCGFRPMVPPPLSITSTSIESPGAMVRAGAWSRFQ